MEDNFQIYSAAVSDRGLSEKRPQNEDSYLEMPNLGLFAVADGVGGAQAGDVASQMAMEILGEAFMNLRSNGDAEEMMKVAIERANSAIYQMSSDLPQLSTMATTIVALHIAGNIATIGHVGDSRLYRLDSKGSLYRETQDHSVVEEEVRAGRMTAAQAANHPSRNVISRALGAESGVEVDMKTIMFDGNSKFLLCSDGITRHISDLEIRELLTAEAAPAEVCRKMKDICYSRGAEDNLTAIIISTAQQFASAAAPTAANAAVPSIDEEATVATARPAMTPTDPAANFADEADEIPTRNLEMPETMTPKVSSEQASLASDESSFRTEPVSYSRDDDEAYLMAETEPETAPVAPSAAPSEPPIAAVAAAPIAEPSVYSQPPTVQRATQYSYDEPEKSGGFGRLLSSLLLLIVGAALGAGAFYAWETMNAKPAEVPQMPQMQSQDIELTSFEKRRRSVESDPAKILAQAEKTAPNDAAEFYFLGRAYLLDKKYEEAVRAFLEARNRLPEYTETDNKSVLETDITTGLLSAQSKAAFERELSIAKGVNSANQSNANR